MSPNKPHPLLEKSDIEEYNRPITKVEIATAIKKMRNSAPGPDRVHPAMLKKLNSQHLDQLTYFLNVVWNSHKIPTEWRDCFILPIKKPKKEKFYAGNYRPISLTNILCRLMERIIVQRLRTFLMENELLDKHQT